MTAVAWLAGSAVRQDGRSASLTAPNGKAQQMLHRATLADASASPSTLDLLELAANGSNLGDPIEAGAVSAALLAARAESPGTPPLALGGIKANVGHTESASGMVGLAKLLSSALRAQSAPNAQLGVLSPHVGAALAGSLPVCALPLQLAPRDAASQPSSATACSFGLGGTIAAALLRARVPTYRPDPAPGAPVYRRRSFSWRVPQRVLVGAVKGAVAGLEVCAQPAFDAPLAPAELELQVRSVALNFRDVLLVLGEYPTSADEPPGGDCSAVVCTAGASVVPRPPRGDQVFGSAPGCLSCFVRCRVAPALMVRRPAAVGAQEACTLPAAYSTVREVLCRSLVRRGYRCLLHAAAGGVGLVALEMSTSLGLRVYGSAGQPAKHRVIREHGVITGASSRDDAAFIRGLIQPLAASRVHAACNSLIGGFVPASLAALCERGAFQEIGKRGAFSAERFGSCMVTSATVVDMAADIGRDVSWFQCTLRWLADGLRQGVTRPLPCVCYPIEQVREAFTLLMSGESVGRVVVFSPFADVAHVALGPAAAGTGPLSSSQARSVGGRAVSSSALAVGLEALVDMVAQVVGSEVGADAPLMEAGLDSLGAVELRNQLQHAAGEGVALPSTVVFDHPTARQLAAALAAPKTDPTSGLAPISLRSRAEDASCGEVSGTAGLLPGNLQSVASLLHAVRCGWDVVGEVPHRSVAAALRARLTSRAAWRLRVRRRALRPRALRRLAGRGGGDGPSAAAAARARLRGAVRRRLSRAALARQPGRGLRGHRTRDFSLAARAPPAGASVYAATGSSHAHRLWPAVVRRSACTARALRTTRRAPPPCRLPRRRCARCSGTSAASGWCAASA